MDPVHGAASETPVSDQQGQDMQREAASPLDRRLLLLGAGLAGVAALTRVGRAGPIDPPAGPVGSTGLTLQQVATKLDTSSAATQGQLAAIDAKVAFSPQGVSEPRTPITLCPSSATAQFVVTQPGAYYLPHNIVQDITKPVCIEVQCDGFDLDGQGFSFVGTPNARSACIRAAGQRDLEFYDFSVRGWGGCPIDCATCDDMFISDCIFHSCVCPDNGFPGEFGAMIRGQDHCEVTDTCVVSCVGTAVALRDCAYLFELTVTGSSSSRSTLRCASNSCISTCAVLMCQSSLGSAMECAHDSTITECSVRQCTCHAGYSVGSRCVVECVECNGGTGAFCVMGDSCSLEDSSVLSRSLGSSSSVQAMIVGGDACCVSEVDLRLCPSFAVLLGAQAVVECCECTGGSGAFCVCGPSSSVEDCSVSSRALVAGTTSVAHIQCADGSCVTECDVRGCTGLAVSVGSNSVIECCEVSGGSGGAFHCADGCCVEDSSVTNHEGFSVECGSRCSVDDNHFRMCWGATCGAECCISGNEMTVSSSALGGGAAITVGGERCCVSDNFITGGGLVVIFGGDYTLLEGNHVSGSGGPAGTGGGSISIAQGVTGCHVRSNHVRRGSLSSAISMPPGTSFGPVVNAIAGGDVSALPGGGSSHANFVF